MAEHTMWSGPFVAAEYEKDTPVEDWGLAEANGSGWFIAHGMTKERAEKITICVNAHDELVSLLENAHACIAAFNTGTNRDQRWLDAADEGIVQALKKARGES